MRKRSDFRICGKGLCSKTQCLCGVSFVSRRDSLDWKGISAEEITQRVLSRVKPGSIVLFHNAAEHTPEALPDILEALIANGYSVVPISQILLEGETYIDNTGMQCKP